MNTTIAAIDAETDRRITQFHRHENHLLNKCRLDDWIDLLTDDFTYLVPTPLTPDNPARNPWSETSSIVDESKESLKDLWAYRLRPEIVEFSWGEHPPQRIRRFVTGLCISPGDAPNEYVTESDVLLSFVRQSDPATLVPCGRTDLVREVDGEYRLARRVVHLDQSIITLTHMRLVF